MSDFLHFILLHWRAYLLGELAAFGLYFGVCLVGSQIEKRSRAHG